MDNRKQHIPDIDFDRFPFGDVKRLFDEKRIFINHEYQRGDVWGPTQQIELIKSIRNSYSIGVLVLYINENGKYEILDGQQRLLTVAKYLNDKIPLKGSGVVAYSKLPRADKMFLDAYSIGYLKLKSHNYETKEEDIIQTFLRLQEGSPLNKAEKINAYRGRFKDAFREVRESHNIFSLLGQDHRFRLRLLCAELLLLELEGDFKKGNFPDLNIDTFREIIRKYQDDISSAKLRFFKGNLDYLERSLGMLLTAMTSRDIIPFYLLVSFLRRDKADNSNLKSELAIFCEEFLQQVHSFSIYDTRPPTGMSKKMFTDLMNYKTEGRKATIADSIEFRFEFIKKAFKSRTNYKQKDPDRFHDIDQKRELFFRQKGLCTECGKLIDFRIDGSSHHVLAHAKGGKTSDTNNAVLLHENCHQKLEMRLRKVNKK